MPTATQASKKRSAAAALSAMRPMRKSRSPNSATRASEPASPTAPHGARRANARSLGRYLEALEAGRLPDAECEVLSPATARGEAVSLALRTLEGLDAARFSAEFGAPPGHFFAAAIEGLVERGLLLEGEAGDLALSPQGRRVADSVFEQFV